MDIISQSEMLAEESQDNRIVLSALNSKRTQSEGVGQPISIGYNARGGVSITNTATGTSYTKDLGSHLSYPGKPIVEQRGASI